MSSQPINGPYKKLVINSTVGKSGLLEKTAGDKSGPSFPSSRVPFRTTRFVEATSVLSPIDSSANAKSLPFSNTPSSCPMAQREPSEIGFRYVNDDDDDDDKERSGDVQNTQLHTPTTPLKSLLKVPEPYGCKIDNPKSPTFREECILEKYEAATEKKQAKDIKVKVRVRMAKFLLRGVGFSCSLIVLAMISSSLSIFNASKNLPPRNHLPPWAVGTKTWPQILVLTISCISLGSCILVFWSYYRGGHRRAEKVAVYSTLLAVAFFIFSSIMWAIAAGILHASRSNGKNKDLWGWSCVDNKRRELFSEKVDYALVCRMQNWTLICCVIEIVLESITIILYSVVFYRYHTKQRLRKSMDIRDRARADLYLAQVRSESPPNPLFPEYNSPFSRPTINKGPASFANVSGTAQILPSESTTATAAKPFILQPPPLKTHITKPSCPRSSTSSLVISAQERVAQPAAVAPGEQTYHAIPIPSPYPIPTAFSDVSSRSGNAV